MDQWSITGMKAGLASVSEF